MKSACVGVLSIISQMHYKQAMKFYDVMKAESCITSL